MNREKKHVKHGGDVMNIYMGVNRICMMNIVQDYESLAEEKEGKSDG